MVGNIFYCHIHSFSRSNCILLPLIAFRLYYQNKYKMPVRALFREGLIAGIILIITLFNILQPRYAPDAPIPEMVDILIVLHHSIFIQLVFQPLFGPQATQLFVDATNGLILLLLGSVLLFIAMYYLLLKRGLPGKQLFLGGKPVFFYCFNDCCSATRYSRCLYKWPCLFSPMVLGSSLCLPGCPICNHLVAWRISS